MLFCLLARALIIFSFHLAFLTLAAFFFVGAESLSGSVSTVKSSVTASVLHPQQLEVEQPTTDSIAHTHTHTNINCTRERGDMLRQSSLLRFSTFALNPETSRAPHGPPRGLINRYVSMGLPPWAAWCNRVNRHALYRMSDVSPRSFLPKAPQEMDVIWLNERVRERVRTSRQVQHVYRQLKYPYVKTGIHYSDILDHWVQVPMVEAATFEIEKDGGFDNFILKRSGPELRSTYGERIRRHLLVRQKEIQKNFVMDQQAKTLAAVARGEVAKAASEEELDAVLAKYGMDAEEFKRHMARQVMAQRKTAVQ